MLCTLLGSDALAQETTASPAQPAIQAGIYSIVPETAGASQSAEMLAEMAQAMRQANCTSPTIFAQNGTATSLITVSRPQGRVASIQRLQSCEREGDIVSCRPAKRTGSDWTMQTDQSAVTWRLGETTDGRTLICGPGSNNPPPQSASCFSLNLCPAEFETIPVARTDDATLSTLRDTPPPIVSQ